MMFKTKLLSILSIILILGLTSFSKNPNFKTHENLSKIITGKVTDCHTGDPIAGVTVSYGLITTLTDADGNFKITVPDYADKLLLTYIGYSLVQIEINGRIEINECMTEET